jgi:hypothetical protein
MSETLVQKKPSELGDFANIAEINQGDRSSRFRLTDLSGKSTLDLADDIYKKCFLANELELFLNKAAQHQRQFNEEVNILKEQIEKWLADHADQIVKNKTKLICDLEPSSTGKIHFRFIVIKKEPIDWISDPLEMELVRLEESLLRDSHFQIIRLDSILVPNVEK